MLFDWKVCLSKVLLLRLVDHFFFDVAVPVFLPLLSSFQGFIKTFIFDLVNFPNLLKSLPMVKAGGSPLVSRREHPFILQSFRRPSSDILQVLERGIRLCEFSY